MCMDSTAKNVIEGMHANRSDPDHKTIFIGETMVSSTTRPLQQTDKLPYPQQQISMEKQL